MVSRLIRYISIALTVIVAISFALFAIDDTQSASDTQQQVTQSEDGTAGTATPRDENGRKLNRSGVRKKIDSVADAATKPAVNAVKENESRWVRRSVPFLFGLLLYGLGGMFLANMLKNKGI